MNTKNTKTAVIVLLVIANIFFIYNIIWLGISSENIPSEMIENAAVVLSKSGFIADKSVIPAKKPMDFMYEGVSSQDIYENIVKSFSGAEFKDADEILVPMGISYAAGNHRFIFTDSDYFRITITEKSYYGNTEEIEQIENAVQAAIDSAKESAVTGNQSGAPKKTKDIIRNFLRKYNNQDARLGFAIISYEEDKNQSREYIWINQTADGIFIDSHIAYAEISGGSVRYFSGKWYFGELAAINIPLLDSVNILFKSMEADGSIVSGDRLIEMGKEYNVRQHEKDRFYLVPSWRLIFKSGIKLSYNMVTGYKN